MPSSKIRVLVVDDHSFTAMGIKRYVERHHDLEIAATASTSAEALAFLSNADCAVDVAVLDLSLGSEDGLELVRTLNATCPAVRVVVHSMHEERIYAERVLRAGAQGYVMKREDPSVLVEAIRKAHRGQVHLSPALQLEVSTRFLRTDVDQPPETTLSDREVVVLRMLGEGHSSREIAESLHLSFKTVQTYRERLKAKLGLKSASELVHYAMRFARGQDPKEA